ncbi:MAG: hypothetical protein ACN4GZ_00415 [Acidimicrobiales bacterium]
MARSERALVVDVKRCAWWLGATTVGLGVASYTMHLVTRAAGTNSIAALDVGDEVSLGTWFESSLFLVAALALFLAGRQEPPSGRFFGWNTLAVVMLALSIDEAVSVHERVGGVVEKVVDGSGYLHYIWVVPGMIFTGVVVFGHLGWLRSLRPSTRNGMIAGGALFVSGAVGLEIAAGPLAEAKEDTLALVTLIAIEEFLEMAGLSVFIVAVLRHLQGARDAVVIR